MEGQLPVRRISGTSAHRALAVSLSVGINWNEAVSYAKSESVNCFQWAY